jgi:hypothetical protein
MTTDRLNQNDAKTEEDYKQNEIRTWNQNRLDSFYNDMKKL